MMRLINAKRIADHPVGQTLDRLQKAHARLSQTLTNGGVRSSERATRRLHRRLESLNGVINLLVGAGTTNA